MHSEMHLSLRPDAIGAFAVATTLLNWKLREEGVVPCMYLEGVLHSVRSGPVLRLSPLRSASLDGGFFCWNKIRLGLDHDHELDPADGSERAGAKLSLNRFYSSGLLLMGFVQLVSRTVRLLITVRCLFF